MEKFATTKGFFQTGKNSQGEKINYQYKTIFLPKKLSNYTRITFYPLKKNFSDLALTNRQFNEEIIPCHSHDNRSTNKIYSKTKLKPLGKNKLFDEEINYYNLKKNKSFINSNFKNKMNESVQSDLYYEEKMKNKLINHQNSMIDYLLNEKMKINKKPKLKRINFEKINIIENIKNFYGKDIFLSKFEKKFLQNFKPIHYYFKEQNINSNSSKNNNISMLMRKTNNFLNNKNKYETVEFGNRKEKIATKLIIDENDNKCNNNLDCHVLMKYPLNSKNISMYSSNYSNILSNFTSSLKTKMRYKTKDSNDNNHMTFEDLKLISQKGFERMKKNRYKSFTKIIDETYENVKNNRKKYDSLLEINLKIYNKNRDEALNNEL